MQLNDVLTLRRKILRPNVKVCLTKTWHVKTWLVKIAGVLLLGTMQLSLAQNLPVLGDAASDALSPATERRLGELTLTELRRDPDYLADTDVEDYLNGLARRLAAGREAGAELFAALSGIDVFAVRDPQINAFAMPGGFIGINSGLVLATQSESELASVLAHEMAHVSQRHIARGLQQQQQDNWLYGAAMLAAVLAARNAGGDAVQAALAFSAAARANAQLKFSRDAEREADRVGLRLLSAAGFDSFGMLGFFGRLQQTYQFNQSPISDYAATHPVTAQRISDIQSRLRETRYRQHPDTLPYLLVRARLRVLQANDTQGFQEAERHFAQAAQTLTGRDQAIAYYGQAAAAVAQQHWTVAQKALDVSAPLLSQQAMWLKTKGQWLRGSEKPEAALKQIAEAAQNHPDSRSLATLEIETLQAMKRHEVALRKLVMLIERWPAEANFYRLQAVSAGALGQSLFQYRAMADYYAATGALPAAIEQLRFARAAGNDFYVQSEIDVRLAALTARQREEQALLDRFK